MLDKIKKIMTDNKIEVFGITSLIDFSFLKEKFDKKSDSDFLADFDSASFEQRTKLEKTYPNAKSIISIVFPYPHFRLDIAEQEEKYSYKISEYACIPDYHLVIKSKLSDITENLKSAYPDFYFTPLVDSNPLLEKEIAKACGTGVFGKNSLIYNKKYGSYIFLSEIITDCKLPDLYADSLPDMLCDKCNLCRSSCPNSAIENSFMINAKKCVSYYTTVKNSFNPALLREYLWGCDICQSVCPVNKNKESLEEFFYNPTLPFMSLEDIIFSSNKKLQEFYKDFPIGWSGVSVVRRNALYLLYNKDREKSLLIIDNILKGDYPELLKSAATELLKYDK